MAKVWVEVYGCSASVSDGEIIKGMLVNQGYKLAESFDDADASIIVTCIVKDATANRMVNRIRSLSSKPLVVAGCMAKAEPKRVERLNSKASIVAPNAIDKICTAVDSAINGNRYIALDDSNINKVNLPRVRVNPVISIVQIATGCLSDCTFCETKLAKGRLRSYKINDIVRQVSDDVKQGCKEVWLTSTDNGAYGFDIHTNIAELLKHVCSIDSDFMVRVGMMNPQYLQFIIDDLIEAYRDDKVFKFLHIPVQSGSNRVLRAMRRGHSVERFIDIVKRFRKELGYCTIATDVIVGFPTESYDDFKATIDLIKEVEPDVVNLSKYSARPNTYASRLKQLSKDVINERSAIMHDVVREVCYKRSMLWKGWEGYILVDEYASNGMQGRNYAYKPIYLHCNNNNNDDDNSIILGSKVKVRVIDVTTHSLIAKVTAS
jgi:threonylcarbamoyladenosine tRNA methylthiotransferase CDKAL1